MNPIWITVHSSGHSVTNGGGGVFGAGAEDQPLRTESHTPCLLFLFNWRPVAGSLRPQSDALRGGILSSCQPGRCDALLCKSRSGPEQGNFLKKVGIWVKTFNLSLSFSVYKLGSIIYIPECHPPGGMEGIMVITMGATAWIEIEELF